MQAVLPFPEISPEIFSISLFGMEFALRWYALAYIAGILIGWRIVVATVKRPALWLDDTPPMTPKQVEDLLTWVILGVILGGRLGFVLFYKPADYLANPLDILRIWDGGMAFHGGLLGVVLACLLFSRAQGLRFFSVADALCLVTPVGLFLGRIANFINAELWGRATDLPWAIKFPTMCRDPEFQGCPVPGAWFYTGFEPARHPSQLYEAGLEGVLLGALLFWLAFGRGALKRPGRITGLFFAGYGLARFLVEFVRQPDSYFAGPDNPLGLALHVDGIGLTMGQLLSLPMIVFGLVLVLWSRKAAR